MLTISPFSGWGKENVAQNNENFTGGTEGKLCYMKRGLYKSFLSSRKPANVNVQKHAKRASVCILEYKWKSAKQLQAKPSHRKRNSKVKRSNKPSFGQLIAKPAAGKVAYLQLSLIHI